MKKLNRKAVTPSHFKKTCPCTILSPLFKIFQITLPPPGEVIKTYFPHFKKKGGLDYVSLHTSWLISVIIRKKSLLNGKFWCRTWFSSTLVWFFPYCSQSSQLIQKHFILEFQKNMTKPPWIWLMHLLYRLIFKLRWVSWNQMFVCLY